jgi:diguanylate cyclase (GGDEF)-like protein
VKTKNLCFSSINNLDSYITENEYVSGQNLLIQIFTCDVDDRYLSTILEHLTSRLPNCIIIGATTDGEILDGAAVSEQTIISFTTFENVRLRAQLYSLSQSHFKIGSTIAKELYKDTTKAIIIFADGLKINGDDLLDGIYDVNKDIVIAGGLAGDYRQMKKTFVIFNNKMRSDAVVACTLDSESLIVNTTHVYGWKTIGKQMIVTKADQNRLYELDNENLINIYAKYLGERVAKELPVSAAEYPLIINRFGKHIARAALQLLPDGSMLYAGNFKVGDRVQLGYGHIPIILASTEKMMKDISHLPIESIFIYSCSARKYFMREQVNIELKLLKSLGGTAGFFTYGEFLHGELKNELLNETMTLLLLSESPAFNETVTHKDISVVKNKEEETFNTLFNLIEATGKELSEANEKLEGLVAEKTKQLIEKVYYDPLTSLPNRNLLIENFSYKSKFIPVRIAIINIDEFKKINDCYGYKVGDKVLTTAAKIINDLLKSKPNGIDYRLYRLPVDEFAIATNASVNSKDFLECLDQTLMQLSNNKMQLEGFSFFLNYTAGISMGRSESEDFSQEIDGVLWQANMALRQAKDTKTQKITYKNDMILRKQLENNLSWTKKIRQAIIDNRFVPYFQPIFSSSTGDIEKYECLIRMIDKNGEVLSPYGFLDVAKNSKLYPKLTSIMIEKCFNVFSKNKKNFSINISILDIENDETVKLIKERIAHYDIGKQLTLEILESEGLADYSLLNLFITEMRKFGCKFAIDDFGSGYSNFRHILMMEIDYLKIDGGLIKNINHDEQNKIMVEMIVAFCKKVNIHTIAEFVSDKVIHDTVKDLGVDYLQGHYLAEPTAEC